MQSTLITGHLVIRSTFRLYSRPYWRGRISAAFLAQEVHMRAQVPGGRTETYVFVALGF
jgi:hypothetical protein